MLLYFFLFSSPDEEDSRPCSPIQSDTEFETNKRPGGANAADQSADSSSGVQQSWRWGELPSPPPKPSGASVPTGNTSSDDEATKQQDNGEHHFCQYLSLKGVF